MLFPCKEVLRSLCSAAESSLVNERRRISDLCGERPVPESYMLRRLRQIEYHRDLRHFESEITYYFLQYSHNIIEHNWCPDMFCLFCQLDEFPWVHFFETETEEFPYLKRLVREFMRCYRRRHR